MADDTDIMGILSIVFAVIFAPIGLILGIVGYSQAKKQNKSTTLSLIGLIISGIFTLLFILIFVFAFAAAIGFGVYDRPLMEGCFTETTAIMCGVPGAGISTGANNAAVLDIRLNNGQASAIRIDNVESDSGRDCGFVSNYEVKQINANQFVPENTIRRDGTFLLKITCAGGSYRENSDFQDTFTIEYTDTESSLSGLKATFSVSVRT